MSPLNKTVAGSVKKKKLLPFPTLFLNFKSRICIGKFFILEKQGLTPLVYITVNGIIMYANLKVLGNLLFEVPFWFWVLAERMRSFWCQLVYFMFTRHYQ